MLDKEWLENTLKLCAEYGYRTTPVFPKGFEVNGIRVPARKFADGQDYKKIVQYKDAVSIGLVLDDAVLLDYDGNKGDVMSIEALEELLDLDLVGMPDPTQINDAGDSIHWLFKLPKGVNWKSLAHSADKAWPHVDIKRGTQLMHLKPHKTLSLLPVDQLEDSPAILIDKLRGDNNRDADVNEDSGLWEAIEAQEDRAPFEQVVEVVESLHESYSEDHDSWVKVGMAIWYETRGSEEGLELFDSFSRRAPNYDADAVETRWPSFANKQHKKPVTLGTLKHFKKRSDVLAIGAAVNAMLTKVKNASIETLELDIIPEIRDGEWDAVRAEQLVKGVQARFKEITGATIKLGDVRNMLKPKVLEGDLVDEVPRPEWCEPWVYLASHETFYNIDTSIEYSRTAFDTAFGRFIPMNEAGQKARPSKFISDHGLVDVVARKEYLPMVNERIIERGSFSILNSFDPRSVPSEAKEYTADGKKAIAAVQRHFRLLCNDVENDALVLEQWFAHQVQNMGVKLPWAPLICSIQGVGKTLMETLLRNVLGSENVGVVAPNAVMSDFNGWATNVSVNVLNELRVSGKNRHEAANALKPLITDEKIQINEKNVKTYQTRNTTDYICFTNFADAIPMDETDRRWWAVRVSMVHLSDIEAITGKPVNEYFDVLHWAVRTQGAQLRKWLLEYEISAEFKQLKTAPVTDYKRDMVATERSAVDFLDEITDIIELGLKWIHPRCVSLKDLLEHITFDENMPIQPSQGELKLILKRMGYTSRASQVTLEGETKRVWTKGDMSNEQIRALFE